MKETAETKEIEFQIEAHPVGQIEKYGEAADVILLGPQVRYELKNVKKMFLDKPVEIINMQKVWRQNSKLIC